MTLDPISQSFFAADRDRFLAHLFLPADRRADVAALHAFAAEIAGIRERVHEPMVGEIRLTFWRDLIAGGERDDSAMPPVAAALCAALARHRLPPAGLLAMIEARRFDLYNDPMPDRTTLEGYLGETASLLYRLTCQMIDPESAAGAADAAGHAGIAFGLSGLLRALPLTASRGQCLVPLDILARHGAAAREITSGTLSHGVFAALAELRDHARHHHRLAGDAVAGLPPVLRPAFVSLALVPAYLRALERQENPLHTVADIAPWRRPWLLWSASRRLGRGRKI